MEPIVVPHTEVKEQSSSSSSQVYVGLKIWNELMKGDLHLTLAFCGHVSDEQEQAIVEKVDTFVKAHSFEHPIRVCVHGEEMMGAKKDLRVRLAHFEGYTKGTSPTVAYVIPKENELGEKPRLTPCAVASLAAELYQEYGKKDYPQRFHITSNKIWSDDTILFSFAELHGTEIYVQRIGDGRKRLYSAPSVSPFPKSSPPSSGGNY